MELSDLSCQDYSVVKELTFFYCVLDGSLPASFFWPTHHTILFGRNCGVDESCFGGFLDPAQ